MISLGFGLGLNIRGRGTIVPPPSGQLLVDTFPILVDSFAIVFA